MEGVLKYDRNHQVGSNCKNTPISILPLWRYELLLIPASVSDFFLKNCFWKLDCLFPSIPLNKLDDDSRPAREIFLYVDPSTCKLTILGYYALLWQRVKDVHLPTCCDQHVAKNSMLGT
jgi:hypothetical protein